MEKHGGYDAPMWDVHMHPMLQQVASELVITIFCLWRGDYFKGGVLTLNSGLNPEEQSQLKHMLGAKSFFVVVRTFSVKKYGMEWYPGKSRMA